MLTSRQAAEAIAQHAPRGEWVPLGDLYEVVRRNTRVGPEDEVAISASNRSPRWKRTVRNALQRQKATGAVEWDGKGRYRLP